jgi:plastocyanin
MDLPINRKEIMKNSKLIYIVVGVIVVLGLVFAVTKSNGSNDKNSTNKSTVSDKAAVDQPGQNEVFIKDFAFGPAKKTVKKGTTITWTNKDDAHHDVSPDKDYGEAFTASKLMAKGESYSYTFNTVGVYSYHCSPHPYMKATIEVTE